MKHLSLLITGACTLHACVQAQGINEPVATRHHFGAGVPVWLKARGQITATRATNPGAAPTLPVATLADGLVNRGYDDGFNQVNAVDNFNPVPGGLPVTSFFGYQADAQVANAVGAGTLSLHSVQLNGGDYSRSLDNQPFPGLEFFYRYDWKAGQKWSLSWELAAAYHWFNWEQNGGPGSTANVLTDVFALNGVALLSAAPYSGPFPVTGGPPVIGSTPTRTEATVAASVTGKRQLQMHALQLRVAPALNWEPTPAWQIGVQAGLALGVGYSQLSYAEQITVADPTAPVISQSGRTTDAHFWAGLFSLLRVNRRLSEHWDAHVEVRHVLTESLQHNAPTRSGTINLSDGFGLGAGVSYRF